MQKKLIIFDCDGVLVDSEFVSNKVFCETLAKYGYQISLEESIKRFTGVTAENCRQEIIQESGIDIPEDYWIQAQPTLQIAYKNELIALMQPVLEILNILQIPRCVASNSSRKHVIQNLEFTQQLQYFTDSSIFSAQQVEKAKPAPDLFLFAAREMGVEPKDCIVIEDSAAGAQAATAAGMQVFMFLGGSHARFDWYRNQIALQNKPMLPNCNELAFILQETFATSPLNPS
jgi:HAD superfamily hydrolase (TIGR01509 family)